MDDESPQKNDQRVMIKILKKINIRKSLTKLKIQPNLMAGGFNELKYKSLAKI